LSSLASTSLPLQDQGLVVGGDVQTRATDVVEIGITEEQAKEIARECNKRTEVANAGDDPCPRIMRRDLGGGPCLPRINLCMKVKAYGHVDAATLGDGGYVEIVDERPGKSLCESGPDHVCLRVGVKTSAVLDQIVETAPPTTSTTATSTTATSTTTPTPTQTEASSPSWPSPTSTRTISP